MNIDESRNIVKTSAYVFAAEGLHEQYDFFLDFLMKETDERGVLPHYFRCLFEDYPKKAPGELVCFLTTMLVDEDMNYLLSGYFSDVRDILKTCEKAQEIFEKYDSIAPLEGEERDLEIANF